MREIITSNTIDPKGILYPWNQYFIHLVIESVPKSKPSNHPPQETISAHALISNRVVKKNSKSRYTDDSALEMENELISNELNVSMENPLPTISVGFVNTLLWLQI